MSEFEQFESVFSKKTESNDLLEFDHDVLASTCSLLRTGKDGPEAFEILYRAGRRIFPIPEIQVLEQDQERAKNIRQHFKHHFTIRRLHGFYMSNWMKVAEVVVSNETQIDNSHLGVLVKLPEFYDNNMKTKNILSSKASLRRDKVNTFIDSDQNFSYVDTVYRKTRKGNTAEIFFENEHKNLLTIYIKGSSDAWGMRALITDSSKKFRIKGTAKFKYQSGFDFVKLHLHTFDICHAE